MDYRPRLEGVDGTLASELRAVSELFAKVDRPPATIQALRYRVRTDEETLAKLLRSRGYYAAVVRGRTRVEAGQTEVVVTVEAGPRYRIGEFRVLGVPDEHAEPVRGAALEPGAYLVAADVLAAEAAIVDALVLRGYPFARSGGTVVELDHGAQTGDVRVSIRAGDFARFGEVVFEGLEKVDEETARRKLVWAKGDAYDPGAVADSRDALMATGAFRTVSIGHADAVDDVGEVAMTVVVGEGPRRGIGTGLRYSSTEGFAAGAYWEHRNLLGGTEKLRIDVEGGELGYLGGVKYRGPNVLGSESDLVSVFELASDDTDAFERDALTLAVGLERRFFENVVAGIGGSFEQSTIEDSDGDDENFTLFGVPLTIRRDTTRDLLDPKRGQRTALAVTPYADVTGGGLGMLIVKLSESVYVPLDKGQRAVLGLRSAVGTILGPARDDIPADKRFYAGGGDSVRGYEFQSVGELDDDNEPRGGRSLLQGTLEVRYKVTESIGVVPFVDAAIVGTSPLPDPSEEVQVGAGLGLRYFTAIGPIRVDVAVPVDRRDVDDAFQIYIGLGQAF